MATRTRLRDGSQVSGDAIQTPYGILLSGIAAVSGVGTGFTAGIVGRKIGAGVDHLGVTANGANRTLTSAAGWAAVQRDSGLNGTPRAIEVEFDSSNTVTCAANASGSGRIDTIALRVDMTTAPDATGSNIATVVIVQGGASNALGNAPADSALYLPLANVAVANGAASLSQGNVTDLRRLNAFGSHPFTARMHQNSAQSIAGTLGLIQINYDTVDEDPYGNCTTGAAAKYTAAVTGWYSATAGVTIVFGVATRFIVMLYVNGVQARIGYDMVSDNVASTGSVTGRLKLALGDTIDVRVQHGDSVARNTNPGTSTVYLDVHLLSPA